MNIEDTLEIRRATHGEFDNHANCSQQLKGIIELHIGINETDLSSVQKEALDMICHKIARIICGNPNHQDHWHDICGYAKLVEERL